MILCNARSIVIGMVLHAAGMGVIAPRAEAQSSTGDALELTYQVAEGQNINAFVRDGRVAAHLLLRNGEAPRLLVAFPAGNSGVGLWFDRLVAPARWTLTQQPQPVIVRDRRNRSLQGIRASATISAPRLTIRQAVLSNVRYLRDYETSGRAPADVLVPRQATRNRIVFARDRVDGAPGYLLDLTVTHGQIGDNGVIIADANGDIGIEFTAASGDAPLTGLTEREILNEHAAPDVAARHALTFLSYREKFLAGSWRFNTYFGRDTLMSVRLLMPVLRPAAIEAGLDSVLARMNLAGEVAHEEGLSEFAILDRRNNRIAGADAEPADAPTLDYGMVDDDFMLAPVVATYLLEYATPAQARAYLAQPVVSVARAGDRSSAGKLLVRNLRYVLAQAKPFADRPASTSLVAIKPGRLTGQWRDSEEGLGRGRYAYDVNAALVPAALKAIEKMLKAGLLDPYLSRGERASLDSAAAMAKIWRDRVPGLFRATISSAEARDRIRSYAASIGVPAEPALTALGGDALVFHAISLDANGAPVPIVNSDEGFMLLFTDPAPTELDAYVTAIMRPFPAGLMTPVGLLTANPAQAPSDVQARFKPGDYHGTDIWSWQQALLAAGLERQLARTDLSDATRARLNDAQARLWKVILATRETANSELWSWAYKDGRYSVVPFGVGRQDVDESNAAQLWSTVYLAVQPPAAMSSREMR